VEQKLTAAQRMRALREKRKAEDWFVLELKIAFPPTSRFAKYAKLAGGVDVIKKELKRKFEKIEHQLMLMEIADVEVSKASQKVSGNEDFQKLGVEFLLESLELGCFSGAHFVYEALQGKAKALVEEKFKSPFKFSARVESTYERLKEKVKATS
jgi:hypothetical protein